MKLGHVYADDESALGRIVALGAIVRVMTCLIRARSFIGTRQVRVASPILADSPVERDDS